MGAIMNIGMMQRPGTVERSESVLIGAQALPGLLEMPASPIGIVVFAHDSGSSRHSTRNLFFAKVLRSYRLGTLLFDLLTEQEAIERQDVFDVPFLGARLAEATFWLASRSELAGIPIGMFGAGTGAAAALLVAAREPERVGAVVSRGGRPDLARAYLPRVHASTLLIVGGKDPEVLESNRSALGILPCRKRLDIVPDATHLFEEPGALDVVAGLAGHWFEQHVSGKESPRSPGDAVSGV